MKFSEVIAALSDGKKVQESGDDTYLRLADIGEGTQRMLVRIWPNGSWMPAQLVFSSDGDEGWSVIP